MHTLKEKRVHFIHGGKCTDTYTVTLAYIEKK